MHIDYDDVLSQRSFCFQFVGPNGQHHQAPNKYSTFAFFRSQRYYELLADQCDQIWRNFATWAYFQKSWANFLWLILYLAKYETYYCNFYNFWANLRFLSSQIIKIV